MEEFGKAIGVFMVIFALGLGLFGIVLFSAGVLGAIFGIMVIGLAGIFGCLGMAFYREVDNDSYR